MKATSFPLPDERGVAALMIDLFRVAMTPPEAPVKPAGPGVFTRLGRWLERSRQREVEAYLATSKDVFELESRLRDLGRRPYY